jgi:hypothetical protein
VSTFKTEDGVGTGAGNLQQMADEDNDIRRILGGDIRASHKIQINFGPGRSALRDFKALISLWESGKHFHGGGDAHMYTCLDHRVFENDSTTPPSALPIFRQLMKERLDIGCGHPITDADIRGPVAMCPGCKNLIPCVYLLGQIPFYGSAQDLAELVTIIFHKLRDDADIYCKYDRTDIRYEMQVAKDGAEKAQRLRALFIYPLYRLLKDIGAGASIEGRFKAFFLA